MKAEELKLYGKYKNTNIYKNTSFPDIEHIFIGTDKHNWYWFLFKENKDTKLSRLKYVGLDPDKIVKDLNLETFINENGEECIKGYYRCCVGENYLELYFKPILKDKLKNIIKR
jgi:hypothetical protein